MQRSPTHQFYFISIDHMDFDALVKMTAEMVLKNQARDTEVYNRQAQITQVRQPYGSLLYKRI